MPIPAVASTPALIWDEKITFPYPLAADVFPLGLGGVPIGRYAWNTGAVLRNNCNDLSYQRINSFAAAGYALRADAGGMPYLQVESAGIGRGVIGMDNMSVMLDYGAGFALAPGAEHCSSRRVWWLKWLMQSPDAAPGPRCGLLMIPVNNPALTRWPDDPVGPNNQGGFGFNGDAAGQWQYVSYNRAGVLLQYEAQTLPAHNLAQWNQFEIVIIGERVGIPAVVEFYFNGAFLFNRPMAGPLIEQLAANEFRYCPCIGGGNTLVAGGHTNITSMEMHRGRYTRAGVAI